MKKLSMLFVMLFVFATSFATDLDPILKITRKNPVWVNTTNSSTVKVYYTFDIQFETDNVLSSKVTAIYKKNLNSKIENCVKKDFTVSKGKNIILIAENKVTFSPRDITRIDADYHIYIDFVLELTLNDGSKVYKNYKHQNVFINKE